MTFKSLALILLSMVTLSACETYNYRADSFNSRQAGNYNNYYYGFLGNRNYTDNALAAETYRAVDRVLTQAKINPQTPLLVGTLNDIDTMETSNTFGRIVTEQVVSRLTQRGNNVTELKLRKSLNIKEGKSNWTEAGEYMMTRDLESLKGEHKAAAVMTGSYAIAGEEIMVNLKLLDVATGKVKGSTDYSVTLDANTRRLTTAPNGLGGMTFYGTSMAYN
jgi:TolB-like protein